MIKASANLSTDFMDGKQDMEFCAITFIVGQPTHKFCE